MANVIEGFADHAMQRASESLFSKTVTARTLREPDDINLRGGEEAMGLRIEEEQSDIERKRRFIGTADDMHLAAQFGQGQRGRLCGEIAANLMEKFPHEIPRQVLQTSLLVDAVIKWNLGRGSEKLLQ